MLATFSPLFEYRWQLVRLLANGEVDPSFQAQPVDTRFHADQPDGRLLLGQPNSSLTRETLMRVTGDGKSDSTFTPYELSGNAANVLIQPDGKILVHAYFTQFDRPVPGGGYYATGGLIRLHQNGSLDTNFSVAFSEVGEVFLRRSGSIIIKAASATEGWQLFELNDDGTKKSPFGIHTDAGLTAITGWVEQPDGRILISVGQTLRRLSADGTPDPTFAPDFQVGCSEGGVPNPFITLNPDGSILFRGFFESVDGFPRRGLVRLLDPAPGPQFLAFTPTDLHHSGRARVQVLRTGNTDQPASVDFWTSDDTAVEGRDYSSVLGTLMFDPMESTKVVEIPLASTTVSFAGRLTFNLNLKNPSQGYGVVAATRVVLLPEVRLAIMSVAPLILTVEWPLPELFYALETSADLQEWESPGGYQTEQSGSRLVFKDINLSSSSTIRFFRVHPY